MRTFPSAGFAVPLRVLLGVLGVVVLLTVAACGGGAEEDAANAASVDSNEVASASSGSSGTSAAADPGSLREVGDCFVDSDALAAGQPAQPCDQGHLFEVFDTIDVRDNTYPGPEALADESRAICQSRFQDATGVHFEMSLVKVLWVHPTAEAWATGDRRISCVVQLNRPSAVTFAELDPHRIGGQVSYYGLQTGDCLPPLDLTRIGDELLTCDRPHSHEVYAHTRLEGDWPGVDELSRTSVEFCQSARAEFLGGDRQVRSEPLPPQDKVTWTEWGDRNLACLLSFDEPVQGSYRGTGLVAEAIQPSNSVSSAPTLEGNTLTVSQATSSAITMGWSRIEGVDAHVLLRTTAAQAATPDLSGWVGVQEIYRGADLEFVDTTVAAGERYVYIIVGVVESGSTEAVWRVAQATDDTSPPVFSLELISELSNGEVVLRWPDATDDTEVVQYEVTRSDDGGPARVLALEASAANEVRDSNLPAAGTVVYSVTAVDLHGNRSVPLSADFALN